MADGAAPLEVPVRFQIRTPLDRTTLDFRMLRNDGLSLPEAVSPKTCIIVGSGPSASHAALWERLEQEPDITTIAVNGALSLFLEHGRVPDYWTCCDPQEEVVDFIPTEAPKTTYLIATKCPETLFQRLKDQDVRIWRLDDMNHTPSKLHVTCAVSITLVTMNLFRLMGYHRFETYGWDCCYLDGKHHASNQPEPAQPLDFSIEDATTREILHKFKITGSWAAELDDACTHAHNFRAMGYEIIVHGPGAVGAFLRAKKLIA